MTRSIPILFLAGGMAAIAPAGADEVPQLAGLPKHQTPVPCFHIRNWHVTQNLGPTGARGWIHGYRGDSNESREILVKSVEPGSPADGVLEAYDVIVGAAVPGGGGSSELRPFKSDARLVLARAITWAESEAGGGELRLLRHRDGETSPVVVKLPVLGDYSPTAPFDCPKTDRIVRAAAAFLAEHMPADGFAAGVPEPINAAFLLGTGDPAYLDHVRRSACRMSLNHTISDAGHETWRWGNTNVFLTEYYLATGDRRVLPTIEEYCRVLAEGQCNPGTWGHRAVPDFIPPGYGSLNASGVVCFLSMILGDQCGVEVDRQALLNSINFYGSYAGRGGIPYGDHPPTTNASSNGKNGMAAVAFQQLGAGPAAQWFARMACSSNLLAFEGGHTGNYFNQTWTPLGASLAGRESYSDFWSRFNSYRDLARRWDGSFIAQPYPDQREGDLGTGNYVSKGPMWSTGGFALSYLATNGRLAMLGRTGSVFSPGAPAELEEALDLYHAKRFEESAAAAAKFVAAPDARLGRLSRQLVDAAERNVESLRLTLADMGRTLELGDLYKLKWQLQAVGSIIDADDPRLGAFRRALEDPANEPVLASGAIYHRDSSRIGHYGLRGFRMVVAAGQADRRARGSLKGLAQRGEGPYREAAAEYLEAHPELRLVPDTVLAPAGPPDKQWKTVPGRPLKPDGKIGGSYQADFPVTDPGRIGAMSLDFRSAKPMKVSLNGTLIFELGPQGVFGGEAEVLLKPLTRELLVEGANTITVEFPDGRSGNFDLALKAVVEPAG